MRFAGNCLVLMKKTKTKLWLLFLWDYSTEETTERKQGEKSFTHNLNKRWNKSIHKHSRVTAPTTNCNRKTVKRNGQKFMTLMLMNFERGTWHNELKSVPFKALIYLFHFLIFMLHIRVFRRCCCWCCYYCSCCLVVFSLPCKICGCRCFSCRCLLKCQCCCLLLSEMSNEKFLTLFIP